MAILNFRRKTAAAAPVGDKTQIEAFLKNYSIEVMPRTAEKVEDFRTLLPAGTRVYIAHIDGTPIEDMVATARRINAEGFPVMPHFPARIIKDKATLADWIARYQGEADVKQALLLGGGVATPAGDFDNSMQLIETGLFDGFERLHVAGHPEGNKDIDPDGSDKNVMQALKWKQAFSERTDAKMAMATQFCFEAKPVIDWVNRLNAEGIDIPVHIGVSGILIHGVYLGGVFTSIHYGLPAGVASLVVGMQPLLTALGAGWLLGERVSGRQWLGLALGFAGVALVVSGKFGQVPMAQLGTMLLPALAALFGITLGTLYQKRFCPSFDLRTGSVLQFIPTLALTAALAASTETMAVDWDPHFVFALSWLVLVLSLGAVSLLNVLIRSGNAVNVASLFYLTPPCTALMAWALFGETLGAVALVGMTLAVSGVAMARRG